jgi:flagellar motor switch/type III secretory pathway protein FliN
VIASFAPPLFGSGAVRAEAWNGLVSLAGKALPLGGGASASFLLSGPPPADAWLAAFRLGVGRAWALVHIRDFPFGALFGVDFAVADLGALPDGLREALYEGMFTSIRALLPARHGETAVLDGQGLASAFDDCQASHIQWFELRLSRPDGQVIVLDVGCDRSALVELLASEITAVPPFEGPLAAHIRLDAEITIGSIELAHDGLGALRPGAVVVLAERPQGRIAIRVDQALYQFERSEAGWRCLSAGPARRPVPRARVQKVWGKDMTDGLPAESGASAGEGEAIPVSSLRVALDFDIGHLAVPVAALAQWHPGTVVELDPPTVGDGLEVTIRANGDVIGQGDVVRIDNRLAVRITRLLLSPQG